MWNLGLFLKFANKLEFFNLGENFQLKILKHAEYKLT